MKRKTLLLVVVVALFCLSACDTNKKLSQEKAEAIVREVLPTLSGGQGENFGLSRCFTVGSIAAIAPVSQFSETEATSVVSFNCQSVPQTGVFGLKFVFKRNIDKQWKFSNLACPDGFRGIGCDHSGVQMWVLNNSNSR